MEFVAFDSAALPAAERFPAWAAAMPFYRSTTPDPQRFVAQVRAWNLAPAILVDATLSELHFERSASIIAQDPRDELVVQLLVDGRLTADSGGVPVNAGPGQIVLHDRAEPFSGTLFAGRNITLSMPRNYLEEVLPGYDLHGDVLGEGLGKMLRALLQAMPDALAEGDGDPTELARLLRDALAASVRDLGGPAKAAQRAAIREQARRHIARNLHAELDIAALCHAIGASRSSVYRAFERHGGIARYAQKRRLSRAHRLIADPADSRSISEIAYSLGFNELSSFSRRFRAHFGYSAATLRRHRVDERPAMSGARAPATYHEWEERRR